DRTRNEHELASVRRNLDVARKNIRDQFLWHATANRKFVDRLFTAIVGGDVDGVSVGRQRDAFDLLIETLRQLDAGAGRAVVGHQPPAIGFETRSRLRTVDDLFAVARVDRARVVTMITLRDILHRA